MPKSGYVIDNYTRTYKDQNAGRNKTFKSVVQPAQVKSCNVHYCLYKRFQKTVDENMQALRRARGSLRWDITEANSTRLIRLNHYYSKSKEEYLTKINVRKYVWKSEAQQKTYFEKDWAFPEWKVDDSMKEAACALRDRGVEETYGSSAEI